MYKELEEAIGALGEALAGTGGNPPVLRLPGDLSHELWRRVRVSRRAAKCCATPPRWWWYMTAGRPVEITTQKDDDAEHQGSQAGRAKGDSAGAEQDAGEPGVGGESECRWDLRAAVWGLRDAVNELARVLGVDGVTREEK